MSKLSQLPKIFLLNSLISIISCSFLKAQNFSVGGYHVFITCADGTVRCWGDNTDGHLGLGETEDHDTLVVHPFLTGIKKAVACADHTLILKNDGSLWSCGANNAQGQLGNGPGGDQISPQLISNFSGTVDMKGGYFSLVLKNDGSIWSFGDAGLLGDTSIPFQVPSVPAMQKIFTSEYTSAAIDLQGGLWMWGENYGGNLGTGDQIKRKVPFNVTGLPPVTEIAIGGDFTLALQSNGTVWAWGSNMMGQLGNDSTGFFYSPSIVAGLNSVVKIAASARSAYALKSDGTVWSWGGNYDGQLGMGNIINVNVPTQIPSLSNVAEIKAGYNSNIFFVKDDGTLWGCGASQVLAGVVTQNTSIPVQIPGACPLIFTSDSGMEIRGNTNVFPNPFSDRIYFEGPEDAVTFQLRDVFGRNFKQKQILKRGQYLQADDIPAGMYLLEIFTSKGRIVRQLLKN